MGEAGEGQNTAHQQKKLDIEALKQMRDRFNIPVSDKDIDDVPYYKPDADSAELEYLQERRQTLGRLPAATPQKSAGIACSGNSRFSRPSSMVPANAKHLRRWHLYAC